LCRAERRPEQPAGLEGRFTLLHWPPGRLRVPPTPNFEAAKEGSSVLLGDTVRRGPEAQRAWASERMVQAATMGCTGEERWAWVPSCDRRPFIKTANSFGRTFSSSSELYFTVNHVHAQ